MNLKIGDLVYSDLVNYNNIIPVKSPLSSFGIITNNYFDETEKITKYLISWFNPKCIRYNNIYFSSYYLKKIS